jgi:hypothetical protein
MFEVHQQSIKFHDFVVVAEAIFGCKKFIGHLPECRHRPASHPCELKYYISFIFLVG